MRCLLNSIQIVIFIIGRRLRRETYINLMYPFSKTKMMIKRQTKTVGDFISNDLYEDISQTGFEIEVLIIIAL